MVAVRNCALGDDVGIEKEQLGYDGVTDRKCIRLLAKVVDVGQVVFWVISMGLWFGNSQELNVPLKAVVTCLLALFLMSCGLCFTKSDGGAVAGQNEQPGAAAGVGGGFNTESSGDWLL